MDIPGFQQIQNTVQVPCGPARPPVAPVPARPGFYVVQFRCGGAGDCTNYDRAAESLAQAQLAKTEWERAGGGRFARIGARLDRYPANVDPL